MKRLIPLVMMLASVSTTALVPAPADAIIVFDPSNYSQNVLTAARTLQQINNQIQSLQNQATSLLNQARNLETIGFSELSPLTSTLQQIQTLMGQASGIQFKVATMQSQFQQLFPGSFSQLLSNAERANQANTRYQTAMSAYQHTMTVQAQIVENVQSDATSLNSIIAKSQGAAGALQAAQATNQLLALTAKQQFQIEQMLAAQYRAEAIDQARRDQAESDGQAATAKFLGSGSAYTPQ